MDIPDLSKLRGAKLPPGVAEQLGAGPPVRMQVPVVKLTTLIGQIGVTDEMHGDTMLRVLRVSHGLPQGSEITQMRLPMNGAIAVARDLVEGTGYRVIHDPDAEVTDAAAAAASSDQIPTADSLNVDGLMVAHPDDGPGIDQAGVGDDEADTEEIPDES